MTQDKRIKVVRIMARLNIGGPAINAILLNDGLDKKQFDTYLVIGRTSYGEGDMTGAARERGLKIEYVPQMRREIGLWDITAFVKIFRFIRKVKPDIVHTHTAKAGALGRVAAYMAGVTIRIHTFHGHVLEGYFGGFKEKIFIAIERALARITTVMITVSESVRDDIVNNLRITKEDKCAVVRLGFELDKFLENSQLKGRFRSEIGVSEDDILIGIVGRLVPIKNHKMFLEAAKAVLDKAGKKRVKFVIVGDGEIKRELISRSMELGLEKSVIFTGWRTDTAPVYADLDIVALSSLNEGTPVSLIEAMASAKPVVSTDVGGVRDIVSDGDNGFLVKKYDTTGLADKMAQLLSDKDMRRRFGERGRESVRNVYTKERLVTEIESIYKKCLAERGRR